MDKETALHAIMLSELPHVGDSTATRILARLATRNQTLSAFLRLPEARLREDFDLHDDAIRCLCFERSEYEARCRWLGDRLDDASGAVLFVGDAIYPRELAVRLIPSPPVLYSIGAKDILNQAKLAVLSSRDLTEQSVAATLTVVQAAAAQGFTIVCGGMKTAYRITAVAGRAADAARVVVLDRGLFATFGANLEEDRFGFGPGRSALRTDRSLILSPFRLLNHAARHNGRRRDQIIAALADVIVAVHARPGGEIERVCLAALDRGQCVLSWYGEHPGLIEAGASVLEAGDLSNLTRLLPPQAR